MTGRGIDGGDSFDYGGEQEEEEGGCFFLAFKSLASVSVKRLEGSNMFQDSLAFESLPRCSITAEKTSHLELTVMTQ